MEQVEHWIWEHAMKHGMSKVLERIHTDYGKSLIPNSWIIALFLQEIKNTWESSQSAITFNEVNSLRQLLSSTYKHYKECITAILETKHFIKFDIVLRATFLVLRSSKCDSTVVKKRAINELFPAWNVLYWQRIKENFYIKDDLLQTEVEQFYSQLRNWLAHECSHKEIMNAFDTSMKQYFPGLITFMRSIKLSILERIQTKNVTVPAQLEFIPQFIAHSSLVEEACVLSLYVLYCERKFNFMGSRFLKLKRSLHQGKPLGVLESTIFSLPPDLLPHNDTQLYPPCFQSHPSMPSCIWLKINNCHQKTTVNRSIPRTLCGTPFEPFWFANSALVIPKSDQLTAMESDENGQSKTKENDSPLKPSDRCQVKEAEGSISQSKDAQLKTHDQQLPPQMASKRTLEKCEPLIQQGADQHTNVPTVLETESSSAKCQENQFLTCRRKSEPAKSSEEDKDAEGSRRPKRPRYSSIHSFGTERSANNHTYYTRPCTQAGTREQTSVVKPTERVSENSNAGQETVPENVNTASSATVELSCQSGSKRRRPLSVWKLVQELSGHSRQLQKLGEDNERNYLNSFLSRLNRYRRSTL